MHSWMVFDMYNQFINTKCGNNPIQGTCSNLDTFFQGLSPGFKFIISGDGIETFTSMLFYSQAVYDNMQKVTHETHNDVTS